jgi:hypothetical protein
VRIQLRNIGLVLAICGTLLLLTDTVLGQEYVRRLRGPATVKGVIGGESHTSYVIRARKGQIMTVSISWKSERNESGDNHAEFYVGELPNFDGDGRVTFGKESDGGRRWSGTIQKTKDYYIYVMAHPVADYVLKVTLK